jgi:UDP-glucose 6-dehydrogenase
VGGPCLEKDSYILAQSFQGKHSELLLNARHLNEVFPSKAIDFIAKHGAQINTTVLVCGAAFKGKPVTSDTRGSFVFQIVQGLIDLGIQRNNIAILDPKVNEVIHSIKVVNQYGQLNNKFDYMVQLTNHEMFETSAFNDFIINHCEKIISFWPKNQLINNSSSNNLFLGGLHSN